jgi:hypothetical protein
MFLTYVCTKLADKIPEQMKACPVQGITLESASIRGSFSLLNTSISASSGNDSSKSNPAINADAAAIEGDMEIEGTEHSSPMSIEGCISLVDSVIKGQLSIVGISLEGKTTTLTATSPIAVRGDGASIDRIVYIKGDEKQRIVGEIRFPEARIGGQLVFINVNLSTQLHDNRDRDNSPVKKRVAINLSQAQIGSDLIIKSEVANNDSSTYRTYIDGQINLMSAKIEGGFFIINTQIRGYYTNTDNDGVAIRADDATILGGIEIASNSPCRFFPSTHDIECDSPMLVRAESVSPSINTTDQSSPLKDCKACELTKQVKSWSSCKRSKDGSFILGTISLVRATIKGRLSIKSSLIESYGNNKAINAAESQILGDVTLESTETAPCCISGEIRLEGSTIQGSIYILGTRVVGALVEEALSDRSSRVAIVASGAMINGGLYVKPKKSTLSQQRRFYFPRIVGEIRLNRISIHSRCSIEGTRLSSPGHDVAISAEDAVFGSSVNLKCSHDEPCRIEGELRLKRSNIKGELILADCIIRASESPHSSGFALNCDMAQISGGVKVLSRDAESILKGIVSFADAKLDSLSIGKPSETSQHTSPLTLYGHLRLDRVQIYGEATLEQLKIMPPWLLNDPLRTSLEQKMQDLHIKDPRTIIGATNASLGTELKVRLSSDSMGIINLVGASTQTLDDTPTFGVSGWGKTARSEKEEGNKDPWHQYASWRSSGFFTGIQLKLDGFRYERLSELQRDKLNCSLYRHLIIAAKRYFCDMLRLIPGVDPGWNTDDPHIIGRMSWLSQQFINETPTVESFYPQPYFQLSKVYRSHGYTYEANEVSVRRQYRELSYASRGMIRHMIKWCFGQFFMFGYSPSRTMIAFVALWLSAWTFTARQTFVPAPALPQNVASICSSHTQNTLKLVLPMVHFADSEECLIQPTGGKINIIEQMLIEVASWICIPIGILTFSGVFREKLN